MTISLVLDDVRWSVQRLLGRSNKSLTLFLFFLLIAVADSRILYAEPRPEMVLQEAEHAFAKRDFERTLTIVEPLLKEPSTAQPARRLKIKSLVGLSRPTDALNEYDHLIRQLAHDDRSLLRDIALVFITSLLKDMREQMRGAAYTALKDFDSPETIPYFEDGVSDGSGLVRTLAVEGLGRLPAGRRSISLNKAMEDQAAMVRAATVKVLGRSDDAATVAKITKALDDEQGVVRITAAGVLAGKHHGDGWSRLSEAATATNLEERATALRMLGETRDERALPILQQAMKDIQPSIRAAAVAGMGTLRRKEAVPFLLDALNDRLPAVRSTALVSLGELGASESIAAVQATLQDASFPVRAAAVATLLQLGVSYHTLSSVVEELASSSDPGARSAVAKALSKAKSSDAVQILESFLLDPLPRPRIAAVRSLGQIGGTDLLSVLKQALRDQDEAVRATAGGALGRILSPSNERHLDTKKGHK